MSVTGYVYEITNQVTKKRYVGSTTFKKPSRRWQFHLYWLRRGIHHSAHLQHSWNKHGSEVFVFSVVEIVDYSFLHELFSREQHWLNLAIQSKLEYNSLKTVKIVLGSDGKYRKPATAETRIKQSKANSKENHPLWGKKMTPEWIENMKRSVTGVKRPTSGRFPKILCKVISPSGIIIDVNGLRSFSRDFHISLSAARRIVSGEKVFGYSLWKGVE